MTATTSSPQPTTRPATQRARWLAKLTTVSAKALRWLCIVATATACGAFGGYLAPKYAEPAHPDPAPDGEYATRDPATGKINGIVETLRHGDFTQWHDAGLKAVEGEYRFGLQNGRWNYYDSSRNMLRSEWYEDGVLAREVEW